MKRGAAARAAAAVAAVAAGPVVRKDAFTAAREKEIFMNGLQRFHEARGTPVGRWPRIGGKPVDLFALYNYVTSLGGWEKVTLEELWQEVLQRLRLPVSCANADHGLKLIYIRHLHLYEKAEYFKVDPDARDETADLDDTPSSRRRAASSAGATAVGGVALAYNYQQHQLSDSVRESLGLTRVERRLPDYSPVERSLVSGLPNEVDFAFNVCLLLSADTRHCVRGAAATRLVELMLSHVGILREGETSLAWLHEGGATMNFLRFWNESTDDRGVKELVCPESLLTEKGSASHHAASLAAAEVLAVDDYWERCLGRDLGLGDVEGQRVMQLAMIIRNLSFEEENIEPMASSLLLFRYLMLCVHNSYACIRQVALETLCNVSVKMVLEPIDCRMTQVVLHTVSRCLLSSDRFEVISAMETLAGLAQVDVNEDALCGQLDDAAYARLVSYLTLPDIQMIVAGLEALYQLCDLGHVTSARVATVPGAVDIFVDLLTLEAQAYGPDALLNIKIVETLRTPAGVQQTPAPQATPRLGVLPGGVTPAAGGPKMGPPASRRLPVLLPKPSAAVVAQDVVGGGGSVSGGGSVGGSVQQTILPAPIRASMLLSPPLKVFASSLPLTVAPAASVSVPLPSLPSSAPRHSHSSANPPTSSALPSVAVPNSADAARCNEAATSRWLRAQFELIEPDSISSEPAGGSKESTGAPAASKLGLLEMYRRYVAALSSRGLQHIVNPTAFDACVRASFPGLARQPQAQGGAGGEGGGAGGEVVYCGLRARGVDVPFSMDAGSDDRVAGLIIASTQFLPSPLTMRQTFRFQPFPNNGTTTTTQPMLSTDAIFPGRILCSAGNTGRDAETSPAVGSTSAGDGSTVENPPVGVSSARFLSMCEGLLGRAAGTTVDAFAQRTEALMTAQNTSLVQNVGWQQDAAPDSRAMQNCDAMQNFGVNRDPTIISEATQNSGVIRASDSSSLDTVVSDHCVGGVERVVVPGSAATLNNEIGSVEACSSSNANGLTLNRVNGSDMARSVGIVLCSNQTAEVVGMSNGPANSEMEQNASNTVVVGANIPCEDENNPDMKSRDLCHVEQSSALILGAKHFENMPQLNVDLSNSDLFDSRHEALKITDGLLNDAMVNGICSSIDADESLTGLRAKESEKKKQKTAHDFSDIGAARSKTTIVNGIIKNVIINGGDFHDRPVGREKCSQGGDREPIDFKDEDSGIACDAPNKYIDASNTESTLVGASDKNGLCNDDGVPSADIRMEESWNALPKSVDSAIQEESVTPQSGGGSDSAGEDPAAVPDPGRGSRITPVGPMSSGLMMSSLVDGLLRDELLQQCREESRLMVDSKTLHGTGEKCYTVDATRLPSGTFSSPISTDFSSTVPSVVSTCMAASVSKPYSLPLSVSLISAIQPNVGTGFADEKVPQQPAGSMIAQQPASAGFLPRLFLSAAQQPAPIHIPAHIQARLLALPPATGSGCFPTVPSYPPAALVSLGGAGFNLQSSSSELQGPIRSLLLQHRLPLAGAPSANTTATNVSLREGASVLLPAGGVTGGARGRMVAIQVTGGSQRTILPRPEHGAANLGGHPGPGTSLGLQGGVPGPGVSSGCMVSSAGQETTSGNLSADFPAALPSFPGFGARLGPASGVSQLVGYRISTASASPGLVRTQPLRATPAALLLSPAAQQLQQQQLQQQIALQQQQQQQRPGGVAAQWPSTLQQGQVVSSQSILRPCDSSQGFGTMFHQRPSLSGGQSVTGSAYPVVTATAPLIPTIVHSAALSPTTPTPPLGIGARKRRAVAVGGVEGGASGGRMTAKKRKKKEEEEATAAVVAAAERLRSEEAAWGDGVTSFVCEWEGCQRVFESVRLIGRHVVGDHFDAMAPGAICQWRDCDGLRRQKWSFMTHLQDRHLSEAALQAAALKRRKASIAAPSTPAASSTSAAAPPLRLLPQYPQNAALHAVRRFASAPPFSELLDGKEGPITKHIRLTSALILRSLARYSALGRSLIRKHEYHLTALAFSDVESSAAISNCLWELQQQH